MPDYDALKHMLQLRLKVISDKDLRENNPEKQLLQLQDISEQIHTWHLQNRSQIPAQLNHFLKQASLNKALEYIENI